MKRAIPVVILSFLCLSVACGARQRLVNKGRPVYVTIERNGRQIKPKGHTITLDRAEFDIVIDMRWGGVAQVNASFDRSTFDKAKRGVPLEELAVFAQGTGLAESRFNEDNDIALSDTGHGYWYADSPDDHRFNEVRTDGGRMKAVRHVASFYDSKSRKAVGIEDASGPLYLVVVMRRQVPRPRGKDSHLKMIHGDAEATMTVEFRECIVVKWAK